MYMLIADDIAAQIEDGRLPPEARLPAELELVELYGGAARETVRRAVKELRDRGLVETVPGKGSFVLPESERPTGKGDS